MGYCKKELDMGYCKKELCMDYSESELSLNAGYGICAMVGTDEHKTLGSRNNTVYSLSRRT